MKKNDFFLVFIVILISIFSYLFLSLNSSDANTVTITLDGEVFYTGKLSDNREIEIGDTNTAIIENNEIYMSHASCPDKLCVRQGKISDSSKKIICLPNKVVIEVSKKSEMDAVVK